MSVNTPRLIGEDGGFEFIKGEIVRHYLVETTDPVDGPDAAASAVAALTPPTGYYIPRLTRSYHPKNPLWFIVDITYNTPPWPDDEPNPLLRASILNASYDEFQVPYFIDSNGKVCSNSYGDPFETFPLKRDGKLNLQLTKNLSSYPAVTYDALKYTRNADVVTIKGTSYAAKTLLFLPPTVSEVTEVVSGIKYHYFATTFRLSADHNAHKDLWEDRGYRDSLGIITAADGGSISAPWPLNGSSNRMTNSYDTPATRTFEPYPAVSWGLSFD